jgi:hypothetical protein
VSTGEDEQYRLDVKALRTLSKTFWGTGGWRRPPEVQAPDALAHAVACGVMFETRPPQTHDQVVAEVCAMRERVDGRAVAAAFVASLSSRRLDLRSALGSWAVAQHVRPHRIDGKVCGTCGLLERVQRDPNVFSFERFRWAGVRHDRLDYVAFDLAQFMRAPKLTPTPDDVALAKRLLALLDELSARTSAPQAVASLKDLPGANAERERFIDLLGLVGVLAVPGRPSYLERFTPYRERDVPPLKYVERAWPVCWWHGQDGVNWASVEEVFRNVAATG